MSAPGGRGGEQGRLPPHGGCPLGDPHLHPKAVPRPLLLGEAVDSPLGNPPASAELSLSLKRG